MSLFPRRDYRYGLSESQLIELPVGSLIQTEGNVTRWIKAADGYWSSFPTSDQSREIGWLSSATLMQVRVFEVSCLEVLAQALENDERK